MFMIETERLTITEFTPDMAQAVHENSLDEDNRRFVPDEVFETVEEAARLMDDYGIGCLPVLKNTLLVGIVTESDLFRTFIDMFDTRSAGVRATIIVDEKPGQLSKVSQAIADLNGNIVAVVTCPAGMDKRRKVTVKASGITLEQCRSIMENCGAAIEDIRNV